MNQFCPIIVVDDDEEDCLVLKELFQSIGYSEKVAFKSSSAEILDTLDELLAFEFPSLIVLDYNMPGENGLDTLKKIKQNPFTSNIPVLIFSTSISAESESQLKKEGALVCLKKAATHESLREQVSYFKELVC